MRIEIDRVSLAKFPVLTPAERARLFTLLGFKPGVWVFKYDTKDAVVWFQETQYVPDYIPINAFRTMMGLPATEVKT